MDVLRRQVDLKAGFHQVKVSFASTGCLTRV